MVDGIEGQTEITDLVARHTFRVIERKASAPREREKPWGLSESH